MLDLEYFRELLCAESGDSQRPAIAPAFKPLTVQAESEKKRAETTGQVIAPLTPIQTEASRISVAPSAANEFQVLVCPRNPSRMG